MSLCVALSALCVLAAAAWGRPAHHDAPRSRPANLAPPTLPVTGASLLAVGSPGPLWSLHGQAELPIASATKMMTALVVLQHVPDLNTVFTQTDWTAAEDDSQIDLDPGERMTVHDLLVALLVPSADDAAEDLAYNVGDGSIARFVAMMNADARTLGLRHTHYSTPIGFDTPGNYSSPNDLVRLARYMMANWPLFRHIVGLPAATLTSGDYVRHIVNTNDLLGRYPWIHGVKTGHTTDAGYVLVAEGRRHGLTLFASVLGTSSEYERDASALALLRWGFSEFRWVRPVRRGEPFARRHVAYEQAPVALVAAHGYRTIVARAAAVSVKVGGIRRLQGPMAKGARAGYLRVLIRGRPAVRIPLILARRLPAVSELTKLGHLFGRPITLLVLALLLGGAAVAVIRGRRKPRRVVALRRVEER